ncbi:UDP-N-acetylglucosamine--N-acetylmuramyl-(pentapeptide) pyrophosphoryl-undecaprenol N-acetylglucosamine transferase [Brevibacterium luteolum]|uniref:UDP-N-acetylglucosamine--N-acetylmuramyl- (pentapeptide) pyrophosphoryl-undecaprenol N-acetylglucosamine transferase n=1 Tax=Brevibacterium luteolum TaxID=199591 RepID=UPI003EEC364B
MTRPLTALFAGGGTTGHVAPMLAIAEDLRFQDPEAEIIMLGTPAGLETRLVPEAGFELVTIDKVPAPRSIDTDLLRFPGRLAGTVRKVRRLIRDRHVDIVVGVGGYVCPPAYLAAKLAKIPVIIHEANARPGLANRLGAGFTPAANIGYTFSGTPLKGSQVGMPIRSQIELVDYTDPAQRAAARQHLGLREDLPTLVVTGGSSGAQRLNEAFAGAIENIAAAGVQILHITGAGKADEVAAAAASVPDYHVVEYVDGMHNAYLAADLLIARSGAGTVAEVSITGVPTVFVPLAIGNGEQRLNAAGLVESGAALMIDNAGFDTGAVTGTILPLLTDPARLQAMSETALAADFPMAAARTMVHKMYAALGREHPHRPYPPELLNRKERPKDD